MSLISKLAWFALPSLAGFGLLTQTSDQGPGTHSGGMTAASGASMSLLTAPVGEANASQDTRAGSTQSPSTKSARALSYDPNLAANYHLDRTNQEAFETALQSRFTPGQGKSWTDKPIMVQFAAPLGYRELRNSLSRNFTEQQISEIKIAVNGRTIPFIGDPKPQDSNYYTFVPEQLTGHDLLVIRLDSPGAGTANPIDVRVDLKGLMLGLI